MKPSHSRRDPSRVAGKGTGELPLWLNEGLAVLLEGGGWHDERTMIAATVHSAGVAPRELATRIAQRTGLRARAAEDFKADTVRWYLINSEDVGDIGAIMIAILIAVLFTMMQGEVSFTGERAMMIGLYVLVYGALMAAVLNAANEIAVASFLDRRTKFMDIPRVIGTTRDRSESDPPCGSR